MAGILASNKGWKDVAQHPHCNAIEVGLCGSLTEFSDSIARTMQDAHYCYRIRGWIVDNKINGTHAEEANGFVSQIAAKMSEIWSIYETLESPEKFGFEIIRCCGVV